VTLRAVYPGKLHARYVRPFRSPSHWQFSF